MALSAKAKSFVTVIVILGIAAMLTAAVQWHIDDRSKFLSYLVVALAASCLKVTLPGITSTMSVNFLFVLVGIVELSVPETLVIGCGATLMQAVARTKSRPTLIQAVFNVCAVAGAISLAARLYHTSLLRGVDLRDPVLLTAVACVYFVANSFP